MTANEMEAFVLLCKKHSIVKARLGDLEIDFGRAHDAGPDAKKREEIARAMQDGTLSDEDALFGSAPRPVSDEQIQAMIRRVQGG